MKQSSLVMIGDRHDETGTVYNYPGVKREDNDADSVLHSDSKGIWMWPGTEGRGVRSASG